ncbi:ClbS/DfsB family four-helix bundle protein [Agromyces bauzanensis]
MAPSSASSCRSWCSCDSRWGGRIVRWRDDRYRGADLEAPRERLRASHAEVLARLEGIEDASLFDPSRHPWLRGALAEPVHECLGGHYEWALGAIRGTRAPR